jgi:hypothetical protein
VLAAELAAGSDPQKRERQRLEARGPGGFRRRQSLGLDMYNGIRRACPRAVAAARVVTSAGRGEECGEGGQRLLEQHAKPARAGTGSLWLTITVFAGEWHDSIETSTSQAKSCVDRRSLSTYRLRRVPVPETLHSPKVPVDAGNRSGVSVAPARPLRQLSRMQRTTVHGGDSQRGMSASLDNAANGETCPELAQLQSAS